MPQYMQFHIALMGSKPLVWRRVAIDPRLTMEQLHRVLQHAMGWTDSHLHEFQTKAGERIGCPHPDDAEFLRKVIDGRRLSVSEMFPTPKARLVYIYDMGDAWAHAVTFEKMIEPPPPPTRSTSKGTPAAIFMGGKRACPPEDCGGLAGFDHILELKATGKASDEDEEEMLGWLEAWEPDVVVPSEAQRMLSTIRVKGARR